MSSARILSSQKGSFFSDHKLFGPDLNQPSSSKVDLNQQMSTRPVKTSNVHVCSLPQKDRSGLPQLPPNASLCRRLGRKFRRLIILNPNNYRCVSFFRNKSAMIAEQRRHVKSTYNYIIHPFSSLCVFLEVSFFTVWIWKMIYDPVCGNLVNESYMSHIFHNHILLIAQAFLISSFFFVGYIDYKTKEIVTDINRVISRYLKTFFFIDILASEMLDASIIFGINEFVHEDYHDHLIKLANFSHIPCLYLRLTAILNFLDNMGEILKIKKKIRKCICYFIQTYMYLHFFTCFLYLVPQVVYYNDWPDDSWVVQAKITPMDQVSIYRIYGECLLMTICYFFGASAGKYPIEQTNEHICLSIVMLFGRLYTLYLLADVLRMFGIVGLSESNYERRMAMLKEFMGCHNLPQPLRERMLNYCEFKFQKRYFNEPEIIASLSGHLKAELFIFSARTLMQKTNVFKLLPQSDVATFISTMKLETYAPGDIIFKSGQLHDCIYFISAGTVAILNSDGFEICHLEDGEIFGLCYSLLGHKQYSAVIVETTDLFVINFNEFFQFLGQYPLAAVYLHKQANERYSMYKDLEDVAKKNIDTCLVELRNGSLLEKRRKRPLCY